MMYQNSLASADIGISLCGFGENQNPDTIVG
jgi:hypothetical protein